MIWRLVFITFTMPVWLVGCASFATVDQPAETADAVVVPEAVLAVEIEDPLSLKTCQRTERDLTVAWQAKRYHCTHENRREALQQVNDREFVAYQYRIKPLAAQDPGKPSAYILPAVATMTAPVEAPVRNVSLPVEEALVVQPPKPLETQVFRVWFPRNHEVLGQQGVEKALELIPAVTDARRVTLRGVYENSEIPHGAGSVEARERFSVGRALAVKKIWRREGVALNKVKILHHQDSLSGRYVEVTLND